MSANYHLLKVSHHVLSLFFVLFYYTRSISIFLIRFVRIPVHERLLELISFLLFVLLM